MSSQSLPGSAEARHFREALAAGGIGTWEWDLASGAAHWSAETYRLLGLAPERTPPAAVEPADCALDEHRLGSTTNFLPHSAARSPR